MNEQNERIENGVQPLPEAPAEHVPVPPTEATPAKTEAEEPQVEIVGVGFRTAGKTYYFSPRQYQLKQGEAVIVETARGVEMGKITIANRMVPKSTIVSPLREILRPATEEDLARHEENRRLELRAAEICRQKILAHKLEMDLVSVEYTFDNSKLLFYFTAENRVDFRDLVKDLASVFKTRIELRQIGIRDEAKLMGGFGVCGRPFCCSTFLSDFVQVSIKMAKEQNFSLNSSKISGACGRLMCCLRYEHDVYEEAVSRTPSNGSIVSTPNGVGVVVETRPLASAVKVRLEEKAEAPRLYAVKDVKVLKSKGRSGLQPEEGVSLPTEEPAKREEGESPAERAGADRGNPQRGNHRKKNPPRGGQGRPGIEKDGGQAQNQSQSQAQGQARPHHKGHAKKRKGDHLRTNGEAERGSREDTPSDKAN